MRLGSRKDARESDKSPDDQASCDLRFENVGSRRSRICDSGARRQSIDDSAGTAGSDAGLTSSDEALVGQAPMDRGTPNERCQGRRFVCVGTTARTHSTPLPPSVNFGVASRAGCDAPYLFANADVSDHNWPFLARGLVALEQKSCRGSPESFRGCERGNAGDPPSPGFGVAGTPVRLSLRAGSASTVKTKSRHALTRDG